MTLKLDYKCERCGRQLYKTSTVWLEFSNTDGNWYKNLPKGHESQGSFPFGRDCAKLQIAENI